MTMSQVTDILIPNIGDFDAVEVIEIAVKPGDSVKPEDTLITLESDKATMDIPAPAAGTVQELMVKVGDAVAEGTLILKLEQEGAGSAAPAGTDKPEASGEPAQAGTPTAESETAEQSTPSPDDAGSAANRDGLQVRPRKTQQAAGIRPRQRPRTYRNRRRKPQPGPRPREPARLPGPTPVRECASMPGNWEWTSAW